MFRRAARIIQLFLVSAFGGLLFGSGLCADFSIAWAKMKRIQPKGYVCYRAVEPIQVDGKLDEPSWQNGPWTEFFVDIEADAKPPPTLRTRAKMLWDDEYFYVAAELEEPNVWGTLTNRDSVIFHDNDFEIFIDPNGDNHEYYEFEMNALNTVWDLLLKKPYKDGGPAFNEWDIAGLKSAVQVRGTLNDSSDKDQGWSLEVAFPWKALAEYAHRPTPPKDGEQWRVDFSRVEWRFEIEDGKYKRMEGVKEDNWVWSPTGIIDMHRPEKWGYVQFSTAPVAKSKFTPDPTAPARDFLHGIYYAERDYQEKHGRFTGSLSELGLAHVRCPRLAGTPRIQITSEGFWATAEIKLRGKQKQRWHIRQDGKVWME